MDKIGNRCRTCLHFFKSFKEEPCCYCNELFKNFPKCLYIKSNSKCINCRYISINKKEYPCYKCKEVNKSMPESEYVPAKENSTLKITNKKCDTCIYKSYLSYSEPKIGPCTYCCEYNSRVTLSFYAAKIDSNKEVVANYNKNYDEHYNISNHQSIEVMQANMTHEEFIGHLKGNIIKYVLRMGRKDDVKKEAAKIRRYAQWLEQAVNGETIDPRKP